MACFLVPAGVAVVTTVVQKVAEKREGKTAAGLEGKTASPEVEAGRGVPSAEGGRASKASVWALRLRWLNTMLWGGVALLALEHVWHGELVPWPPFLTAMQIPGAVGPMLREMATYGSTMTVVILAAWAALVGVVELRARARRARQARTQAGAGAQG